MQDLENDTGMQHVGVWRDSYAVIPTACTYQWICWIHLAMKLICQGPTIWTEDHPCTRDDLYFVLPNMNWKFPGTDWDYNGIAIKLSVCVLMRWWDGLPDQAWYISGGFPCWKYLRYILCPEETKYHEWNAAVTKSIMLLLLPSDLHSSSPGDRPFVAGKNYPDVVDAPLAHDIEAT